LVRLPDQEIHLQPLARLHGAAVEPVVDFVDLSLAKRGDVVHYDPGKHPLALDLFELLLLGALALGRQAAIGQQLKTRRKPSD